MYTVEKQHTVADWSASTVVSKEEFHRLIPLLGIHDYCSVHDKIIALRSDTYAALLEAEMGKRASYVCGFAFSLNLRRVWLIVKNRPAWQKGRVNGIGGRVEGKETATQAMVREFKEETGVVTSEAQWLFLEGHKHKNGVEVSFFAARLEGHDRPTTTTDEQVLPFMWQEMSLAHWQELVTIENIPYLVNKGFSYITSPEEGRMALQQQEDKR